MLLIILDGWGCTEANQHNAISLADTPNWDKIWANYPHAKLKASGLNVGLPKGQIGNSEVGHMTIGSGRVILQDLTRIDNAIDTKFFAQNSVLLEAFNKAKLNNSKIHLLGLLSPGGVHSHERHIKYILDLAKQTTNQVYLHAFLDGRDTPPKSAKASLELLNNDIASIMGRFYAMDRDKRMERTQKAIDLLVNGKADYKEKDALSALDAAYKRNETDEFVTPTKIKDITVADNDIVITMNFRSDRLRQLCNALLENKPNIELLTLTEYDKKLPAKVIFPKEIIHNTLSETLAKNNLSQLHIAETEKYAHVTFFFNASKEEAVTKEERVLIPSPKVTTYDKAPEMAANEITDNIVNAISNKKFDVIICNFANADMVGHTGNLAATIKAIECLDRCLARICDAILANNDQALITSDHGNAEQMWDIENDQQHTAHTTNLVPLVYVGQQKIKLKDGSLADISPTLLDLLKISKPKDMTGTSLIVYNE